MALSLELFDEAARRESDSLIFKTLRNLNRFNSATLGAVAKGISEGQPLEGFIEGFQSGERGGRDVLASLLGGTPEDQSTLFSLAIDFLNPLDPLNYIGVGGLTKVGKAGARLSRTLKAASPVERAALLAGTKGAKEIKELAKTLTGQATLRQRSTLTFNGRAFGPKFLDEAVFRGLGAAGTSFKGTRRGGQFVSGVNRLFGGKKGEFLGALEGPELVAGEEILPLLSSAKSKGNIAIGELASLSADQLKKLKPGEHESFLALREAMERGDGDIDSFIEAFVRSGEKGAERRRAAHLAAVRFNDRFFELSKDPNFLGGTGLGEFTVKNQAFTPRMLVKKSEDNVTKGSLVTQMRDALTGDETLLRGPSNNGLNQGLVQPSTLPIGQKMVNTIGQAIVDAGEVINGKQLKGIAWLRELQRNQPTRYSEFIAKYRLSRPDADRMLANQNLKFDTNVNRIFSGLGNQIGENIEVDSLIDSFVKEGIAKPWDEAFHANAQNAANFVKIDQGRWINTPLAVPKVYSDAFEKYVEVAMPTPDKSMFAELMHKTLGDTAANIGALKWWKGFAIMGAFPAGYLNRNFVTGVFKNYVQGMGARDLHFYQKAMSIINDAAPVFGKGKLDISGAKATKGKIVSLPKSGVDVEIERVLQDYMRTNMGGGGGPDADIIKGVGGRSEEWRQFLFGPFHRTNARVEMMIRLPAMLKEMDETLALAKQMGRKVEPRLRNLNDMPSVPGDIYDVALTNAHETVIAAHFDYDDLTSFERKIRANFIPFYTWSRKNIPSETINMMQNFGKYMPFARGMFSAFQNQQITPEDLPEWAQKSFALPMDPEEGGRVKWFDFTGFLPFMDVIELGDALGTAAGIASTVPGVTRQGELLRYGAIRFHPAWVQAAEQLFQRNAFTRRAFGPDSPNSFLGQTIGAPTRNVINLFRPATDIDRLNPFDLFSRGGARQGRNEAQFIANPITDPLGFLGSRTGRALTGVKVFQRDEGFASLSQKQRRQQITRFKNKARKARREGNESEAKFFETRVTRLEKL